ncbi:hypothetical protein BN137_1875 [Cronobacter condimenti 1330]|uniref:Inner membrane protein n=1 Tax=Cronobacter condimenti 1330 TaxID=1073999 RepID=K8AE16_9ENTR|nr:hypothetical protein [Cronobacter condimenti]ALB64423.1 hypothetical protein AFK62_18775 [Cronobacter condimenti 1330]CCJ72507.1 hypothetical protein BN137_1875 [Cronobacter condimenti 1330]
MHKRAWFYRVMLFALYVSALAALLIVTVDKYAWMSEIDPAISSDMIIRDAGAANGGVTAFLALVFALITQVFLYFVEKSKPWKFLSAVCVTLAILIYALR